MALSHKAGGVADHVGYGACSATLPSSWYVTYAVPEVLGTTKNASHEEEGLQVTYS